MDPKAREALAMRVAQAALDLAAVRCDLERLGGAPYEGAGTSLWQTETDALNVLALDADAVQMALLNIAQRLDRDLASKV